MISLSQDHFINDMSSKYRSYQDSFSNTQSQEVVRNLLAHYFEKSRKGLLMLIYGPCYSGKTLSAIMLGRVAEKSGSSIAIAQPAVERPDDIFEGFIQARNGEKYVASSYSTEQDIRLLFLSKEIVVINEFQFTPEGLQDSLFAAIMDFIDKGGCAILAGLYYSSLRTIFPFSERIKRAANYSYELRAVCEKCGKPNAVYSQRLINGKPASATTPLFLSPSAQISYVPRCIVCHVIQ